MNSLPLSVSIPRIGNGKSPRARCSACTTPCWVRCRSGKHSVQVVATSVNVNVYRKKCAFHVAAAVGDQVTLEEPRLDIGPLGERAYWDLVLQQPPWLCRAQPVRLTQWAQQPVHRRWAERQQLFTDLIGDDQVAMALKGGDELRQERHQPLCANPVCGRPDHA